MTDIDVIRNSVTVLGSIKVPIELLDSVGAPIYQVRKNLSLLLNALEEKIKESEQEKSDDDQPATVGELSSN